MKNDYYSAYHNSTDNQYVTFYAYIIINDRQNVLY